MKQLSIAMFVNLLQLSVSVRNDHSFITIPCQAKRESDVQYRRLSWYKVEVGSEVLTGLVTKDLHTHETVLYKFANQSYKVKDDYSLLLPEAEKRDCGHYRCTLWPPLGHYIQNGDYEYYPLALCLVIYTALCYNSDETSITIHSEYNTEAILPCIALSYSKHYTSITWYKQFPVEEGIIRNSWRQNKTQLYKNYENRTDVFLTEGSLVLKKVNFSQAGRYKCYLAGKVGHRNNDSYVILNVTESVTETTPTVDVTTTFISHTNSSMSDLVLPVDVSPMSVLAGFFSISLSKVILCFACVWGMATYKKHQRRRLWS
ncbi:hypothetical protein QTP86_034025 [Hemibagrus guttatus]|nr:hypothetical protein QTP86_034025 [Hemibagrus guttatus]